jgi:DNA ligase-1
VATPVAETKPETKVHPMFAKRRTTPPKSTPHPEDIKPIITPTKGGTITSTTAEPVEALDLDTDAFLFRPERVDTSKWPKGRLPYSILVGVYVQVSSTRSRLVIVRVLTK